MLSAFRRKKFMKFFNALDTDNSGAIDHADYKALAKRIYEAQGITSDDPRAAELHSLYDQLFSTLSTTAGVDSEGRIAGEAWLAARDKTVSDADSYNRGIGAIGNQIFKIMDTDKSGQISLKEFSDFASAHGVKAEEAAEIFKEADQDRDGVLSKSEFLARHEEFNRSEDPNAPGNNLFGKL